MKITFVCSLIFLLLASSCKKESNPVDPENKPKYILMQGYGAFIDSSYYKLWSDDSWERFNRVTTVNGKTYVTVINENGDEYFYDQIGYCGFKPINQSLILFDKTLMGVPDSIIFNQTYIRETSFFYQGYNYTMRIEQVLKDTVNVSVPIGMFNACLWFSSKATVSAAGQSEIQNSQVWVARGPSDIKQTLNNGLTIVLVKANVNGASWGQTMEKSKDKYNSPLKSQVSTIGKRISRGLILNKKN